MRPLQQSCKGLILSCETSEDSNTPSRSEAFRSATARSAALGAEMPVPAVNRAQAYHDRLYVGDYRFPYEKQHVPPAANLPCGQFARARESPFQRIYH